MLVPNKLVPAEMHAALSLLRGKVVVAFHWGHYSSHYSRTLGTVQAFRNQNRRSKVHIPLFPSSGLPFSLAMGTRFTKS